MQTLSRLNRAHPKKHDVFVLDFMNDADTIQEAFADYYRTTILSEETDPNKLHDLKAELDGYQVYADAEVDRLVTLYLDGADRDRLDPHPRCLRRGLQGAARRGRAGELQGQGARRSYARTASSPRSCRTRTPSGRRLSIFLNFLVPKLPAPVEEDLSKGILESIDMDSYRVEKKAAIHVQLADEDAEIEPLPTTGGRHRAEPELDRLSNILKTFNDQFGHILWEDEDRVSTPHYRGDSGQGCRGHRLSQRPGELRQAKRKNRA